MAKTKVVFIGNSIVNGFPHKRSQCFVSLYREATGFEVINKGQNGETTAAVLARLQKDALAHRPDLVYLLSGTNDFIYKETDPAGSLALYDKIADMVTEAGARPVLLIPLPIDPPMASRLWIPGIDYAAIARQLEELRRLMLAYKEEKPAEVLDTHAFFAGLYTEETKEEYLRDGLHPTVQGHEALARFLAARLPEQRP